MLNCQFFSVVFNDEIHTFDEVIDNLPRAADVDKETAMGFATLIDREGRCLVRCAGFAACSEVKNTVEKKSMNRSGKKPLKVSVITQKSTQQQRDDDRFYVASGTSDAWSRCCPPNVRSASFVVDPDHPRQVCRLPCPVLPDYVRQD